MTASDDHPSGFRAGGADEYANALAEKYEPVIAELRERIAEASNDAEKHALAEKLAEVEAEYRRRRRNARRSWF